VLLRDRGLFVAEGRLVVRRLLRETSFSVRSLLVTEAALRGLRDVLEAGVAASIPIYVADVERMRAVTGFNFHRGCLALAERPRERSLDAVVRAAPSPQRFVILERVGNADNVGAVFRNAAAFDAAVLLGPGCCDPLYRKAIRVSMGASLTTPWTRVDPWPDRLQELRARAMRLIALTPRRDADDIAAVADRALRDNVGLLLGCEGEGLSSEVTALADVRARIPMKSGLDSLNVATAAAIALYRLCEPR